MLNKTKSKIIIEMKHLDHANKLYAFLKEVRETCGNDQGGDMLLSCNGKNIEQFVGHDIIIRKLTHVIGE